MPILWLGFPKRTVLFSSRLSSSSERAHLKLFCCSSGDLDSSTCSIPPRQEMSMSNTLLCSLWDAVVSEDAARVHVILEHSGDAAKSPAVGALLWHSMGRGDLQVAKELVLAGANLTTPDPGNPHEDISLLHFAAARSDNPEFERFALLLLEHGADAHARDVHDWSVLCCAVEAESAALVTELLRRGAALFEDEEPAASSALELAADSSEPMLQLLVFDCEDEAARNERAFFVAQHYMDCGEEELVQLMLDRGLPVDYVNRVGWTLLHCAVGAGDTIMVNLLLKNEADVNRRAAGGMTPLHQSCCWPDATIALLLLEAGADVHATNAEGRRPLHEACLSQAAITVNLLLQLGADVCATDAKGRTPLSLMGNRDKLTFGESLVIQQLALLSSLGRTVPKSDLQLIESKEAMRSLFRICSDELEAMRRVKIFDHVSYFSVLSWSPHQVSALARNPDFVGRFKQNRLRMSELFPAFAFRLTTTIHVARRKQKILRFVSSRLVEIFGDALPHLVIDNITSYLCSDALRIVEKDYFLKLHDKIDRKIDIDGRP